MHKSIFTQFFYLCFSLVAGAIVCVGAIHIFISVETYQRDRKEQLMRNTAIAAGFAEVRLKKCGSSEDTYFAVSNYFNTLAAESQSGYFMTDKNGNILSVSSDCADVADKRIPPQILGRVKAEGAYSFSSLNGFYSVAQFNFAYMINDGSYYVFGRMDSDKIRDYMTGLLVSFLIAALMIMVAVYPLLYFSIMRIVRPISNMALAARNFGEGDFSVKLKVADNTELGYLGSSLNEMAASLEKIEESRKSFVSNVSHELKTPMTTIGGFVDGILDGTIPKQQHRYYLRIVSEEVDRLARLVRSMLNISKYESGEVELQTENFEGKALIFKTALLFEKRIEAKHVNVEGLDGDSFYLCADVDLAQQVIYNLTENAVKFVNDGGTITFSYEEKGEFTAIRVRNSGEGLKENEISKVFDRFYKTDESRGKDKTGVGLGLSIVRSIVRLHKGDILVRSKAGEYTEFEFTLPTGVRPARHSAETDND